MLHTLSMNSRLWEKKIYNLKKNIELHNNVPDKNTELLKWWLGIKYFYCLWVDTFVESSTDIELDCREMILLFFLHVLSLWMLFPNKVLGALDERIVAICIYVVSENPRRRLETIALVLQRQRKNKALLWIYKYIVTWRTIDESSQQGNQLNAKQWMSLDQHFYCCHSCTLEH